MLWNYLMARLSEASTWRGLVALATAGGIALDPDQTEAIIALGLALIGAIGVFTKDKAATVKMFAVGFLLMGLLAAPAQAGTIEITSPMETSAVGFWFPGDDTFAAGVAHTVARVTYSDLPKLVLDVDGTLAKEVNETRDTLGGIGIKLGYNTPRTTQTGIMFVPSVGVTALNNLAHGAVLKEIFSGFRIAVYGTVLLYKW